MASRATIIFFGTFGFAVPVLEALVKAGYDIVAVVTNPDKPTGRKKTLTPPPVKIRAQGLGFRVLQPISLKDPKFINDLYPTPYTLPPDIGIVVAYGKIIPPEIFNLPKHGTLNIHPSLLPKYRGPSPVQTAILNGDLETGVTIMKLDEEMDHGDIVSSFQFPVSREDNYKTLHTKLFELGAKLLINILPNYLAGKIKPEPQDHFRATYTHKFTAEDGEIEPTDTIEQAYNKIRALNPEPGTYIWFHQDDKKIRLKILEAEPLGLLRGSASKSITNAPNGLFMINNQLALKLNNGYIILRQVQPEGKKPMKGEDFARGYFVSH